MKNLFYFLSFLLFISYNNSFGDGFNSVHTSDGIYIIAVGDSGLIFRSVNSGNTWASYIEPFANFKSVYTLGNDVWLSSDNGKVYESSKATTILSSYNTGVSTSINSVFFLDANNGFVCGDDGFIFKSINGGIDWIPINVGVASVKLNSIHFKDALNGVVVGDNGSFYKTTNGGAIWTSKKIG